MNYSATVETIPSRNVVREGTRLRANLHQEGRPQWSLPATIRSDASIEHAGIARSVRFMARNFHTPIRVTDLMVVAGLSRRGFLKSFRKHTGRAPGEILRGMRIEQAKRMLAERDLTLVQLAAAVGFRKTNSFWVAFRSVTGLSPMKYQMQVRAGIKGQNRPSARNGKRQRRAAQCR